MIYDETHKATNKEFPPRNPFRKNVKNHCQWSQSKFFLSALQKLLRGLRMRVEKAKMANRRSSKCSESFIFTTFLPIKQSNLENLYKAPLSLPPDVKKRYLALLCHLISEGKGENEEVESFSASDNCRAAKKSESRRFA